MKELAKIRRQKDSVATQAVSWNETPGFDAPLDCVKNVSIRLVAELDTPPKELIHRIYFDGLDVLHCYAGHFRFIVGDSQPIVIGPEDVLIIYPGRHVTIEALDRTNKLVYGIFTGDGVVGYFNRLGYYDCMMGCAPAMHDSVTELRRQMVLPISETAAGRQVCMSFLTDILMTLIRNMRDNGECLVFDAVREIRRNLQNGLVRIEPLCENLKVSRSYLHRVFQQAGLCTPADFIKREQLALATSLLKRTRLPIAEVAKRAGFISTTHFATFVRRHTGYTPTEIRRQ